MAASMARARATVRVRVRARARARARARTSARAKAGPLVYFYRPFSVFFKGFRRVDFSTQRKPPFFDHFLKNGHIFGVCPFSGQKKVISKDDFFFLTKYILTPPPSIYAKNSSKIKRFCRTNVFEFIILLDFHR